MLLNDILRLSVKASKKSGVLVLLDPTPGQWKEIEKYLVYLRSKRIQRRIAVSPVTGSVIDFQLPPEDSAKEYLYGLYSCLEDGGILCSPTWDFGYVREAVHEALPSEYLMVAREDNGPTWWVAGKFPDEGVKSRNVWKKYCKILGVADDRLDRDDFNRAWE